MEDTHYADPTVVQEAADSWSDAVLTCRLNGHAWKPSTVTHNNRGYTIRQRCTRRCRVERECLMDSNGFIVKPWSLTYPSEGYLLEKNTGRIDQSGKAVMRLTALRSVPVLEVDDEP